MVKEKWEGVPSINGRGVLFYFMFSEVFNEAIQHCTHFACLSIYSTAISLSHNYNDKNSECGSSLITEKHLRVTMKIWGKGGFWRTCLFVGVNVSYKPIFTQIYLGTYSMIFLRFEAAGW